MKLNMMGTTASVINPQPNEKNSNQFPDSSCGNSGDNKILLAYATKYGSTREVAEVIGQVSCQAGATVDIKCIKNVKDLSDYDAVIIGSAIQYDQWMPEARKFVTTHQNNLSKIPVAFFFTCLTLSSQTEKAEHQAMAYSDKLYALHPQIKPFSVGRFAGVLDYRKMSFFSRLIARGILTIFGVKEGDYRNWDAIRLWANDVHTKLNLTPAEKGFNSNCG